MRWLILFFLVLPFLVGGAFSLVLSKATPKDLGVQASHNDLTSALAKAGVSFEELPPAKNPVDTIQFSGRVVVDDTFTSEELTSVLQSDPWMYNFIPDTQIKFYSDGTVELAGMLYLDRLNGYIKAHVISPEEISPVFDKLALLGTRIPYTLRAGIAMEENDLTLALKEITLVSFPIPPSIFAGKNEDIAEFIETRIFATVPNMSVTKLVIGGTGLYFRGTFPKTIAVTQKK